MASVVFSELRRILGEQDHLLEKTRAELGEQVYCPHCLVPPKTPCRFAKKSAARVHGERLTYAQSALVHRLPTDPLHESTRPNRAPVVAMGTVPKRDEKRTA